MKNKLQIIPFESIYDPCQWKQIFIQMHIHLCNSEINATFTGFSTARNSNSQNSLNSQILYSRTDWVRPEWQVEMNDLLTNSILRSSGFGHSWTAQREIPFKSQLVPWCKALFSGCLYTPFCSSLDVSQELVGVNLLDNDETEEGPVVHSVTAIGHGFPVSR